MEDIQQLLYFTPALPCIACGDGKTNQGGAFTAESQGLEGSWFHGAWVLFPVCGHEACQAKVRELIKTLQAKVHECGPGEVISPPAS